MGINPFSWHQLWHSGCFVGCVASERNEKQISAHNGQNNPRSLTMTIMNLILNEEGATALEYGLLAALIAVAIIGSVQLLSTAVQGVFTNAATKMNEAMATAPTGS